MSNQLDGYLVIQILAALKKAGQTKQWLAENSGIPYSTLNRKMTRHPEKFTVAEVAEIARVFNVSLFELWMTTETVTP